jgi:hypothetical protein
MLDSDVAKFLQFIVESVEHVPERLDRPPLGGPIGMLV